MQSHAKLHCKERWRWQCRGIYSWDFPALRQRFLQPAVAALRPLVSLSVQSQVLYYTAAQVRISRLKSVTLPSATAACTSDG